jgi:hypothetical protein
VTVDVRDWHTILKADVGIAAPHVSNKNQVAHLAVLNEVYGEFRPH